MPSVRNPRRGGRVAGVEVELEHVNLARDGRAILRDISWHIEARQRWVLLGANGAGKTQLLKLVAGAVWPNPDTRHRLRWRRGRLWHNTAQQIKDEIAYVGPERQDRHERHEWNHSVRDVVGTGVQHSDIPLRPLTAPEQRRVQTCLRRLRVLTLAQRRFLTLSYGERRRVLLARALAAQPGLLLLDELLTGLDAVQRRAVLGWLQSAANAGTSWVLSTHRPQDIPANTTHMLVLVNGAVDYCGRFSTARLRAYFAPPQEARRTAVAPQRGAARAKVGRSGAQRPDTCFRFSHASIYVDYIRVLRDLDWEVRPGECWIVRGANGTGKSTLLRTIYGDHTVAAGGSLRRAGMVAGVPLSQFKRQCGLVAPHLQTDYPPASSVLDVVVSGLHDSIGLNDSATPQEQRRANAALRLCGAEELADRRLAQLSYGQVRRVLFARALVGGRRLLLLDEAFAGLDRLARSALLELVDHLVQRGVAVVLATHLREELPARVSHELRLRAGRATAARIAAREASR